MEGNILISSHGVSLKKRGFYDKVHVTICHKNMKWLRGKHILEITCAQLFSKNVPKYLWGEALLNIVHLIDKMPSKVLNCKMPLSVLQQ